jgi:hypothetical protein
MHAEIVRVEHGRPCELAETELDGITGGVAFLGAIGAGAVVGLAVIGTVAAVGAVAYYGATGKGPREFVRAVLDI